MWRLAKPTSRGGNSVRSVFTLVIAAFMAVLFVTTVLSAPTAHAANATWKGSAITYEGNPYNGPVAASTVKALALFDGVQAYTYVEPASNPTNPSTNGSSSSNSPPARKIYVIYFAKDVDVASATKAQYRVYNYENKTTFTNPTSPVDIGIDAQSASSNAGTSACEVDWGVGWWICPITNFLAWGTDQIFTLLSGFLTVQPPQTGQDNALYRAWSYMRSIANVAFVIVFLIIIYSQISNIGLDSYGIKKLLPRLIIAALLVNLSYFICAIAIDASNIIGYSLQDIFLGIRNTLVGAEGNGYDIANNSFQNVAGFILSGGTAATAGLIGGFVVLTDFGVAGSLFLLLPALVGAILALLVALIVMAARQAIIIILVIISPLAFVAYLLPNTEKWFEKWRETFMTMLILFPAFSLVFGGSQLAGTAIIQSADSINLVLLGMMVQVAPLFITPLLMRLGGDLLRQVGEMVNKPRQALQGAVKDFTKDRTDNIRDRRLRDLDPGKFQPLRRGAHWRDSRRRNREELAKAAGSEAEARWANDRRFRRTDQRTRFAEDRKHIGEHLSEAQYNNSKLITDYKANALTRQQQVHLDLSNAKHSVEHAEKQLELQHDEFKAYDKNSQESRERYSNFMRKIAANAVHHYEQEQAVESQIQFAKGMQIQNYANELKTNESLRRLAGGTIDPQGFNRVLYSARAIIDEAMTKSINEIVGNSGIRPGDVNGLQAALDKAVANQDLAGMVAYTRLMAQSEDFGVKRLEEAVVFHETRLRNSGNKELQDLRADWKHYINYEPEVNKYSESIASWSRLDPDQDRSLDEHRKDAGTWRDMRLEQFSLMKKSQQMRAIKALLDSDKEEDKAKAHRFAEELVNDSDLRINLKQSAIDILQDYVNTGTINDRKLDSMLSDSDGPYTPEPDED